MSDNLSVAPPLRRMFALFGLGAFIVMPWAWPWAVSSFDDGAAPFSLRGSLFSSGRVYLVLSRLIAAFSSRFPWSTSKPKKY